MKRIKIDCSQIKDWESFHDVFAEHFGFPDFYGRNMDAWIDCMSYLDDPDSGMTKITCATAMIEGIRKAALKAGIVDQIIFDKGIQDLYRTAEADGVFCYTFFKAFATKK